MKRRFIKLEEALEITCHDTVRKLARWIQRWNLEHPDQLILRPHGKVEVASLKVAWKQDVLSKTPGARRIKAAQQFINQGRGDSARPRH